VAQRGQPHLAPGLANGPRTLGHLHVYRSLFIQARGVRKKELMDQLRSKRRMRRSRHASEHGHSRGQIVDAISIRERPAEAEDRAIPGHWEGDLGGTAFTLPHAGQSAEQRNGSSGCCIE